MNALRAPPPLFCRMDNIQPHSIAHPECYSHNSKDTSAHYHEVSVEQNQPQRTKISALNQTWGSSLLSDYHIGHIPNQVSYYIFVSS